MLNKKEKNNTKNINIFYYYNFIQNEKKYFLYFSS